MVWYLQEHGVTVHAQINQQAEARRTGQVLPPLQVVIFGNPKAGVPVMVANPLDALDLPLKVVVWEDEQQQVWMAYYDAGHFSKIYAFHETISARLDLDELIYKDSPDN
jgi:uncharacterized protein (DUF302 family)